MQSSTKSRMNYENRFISSNFCTAKQAFNIVIFFIRKHLSSIDKLNAKE